MRGLILAAGRGSRMQQSTAARPKCLVNLLERPLLEWQLEALAAAGVGPIALVTGYQHEALESYALPTFHNSRWAATNMVASLRCGSAWLEPEGGIVAYSDIVYRPAIVQALAASERDLAITYDTAWESLWRLRFEDPLEDAETFCCDARGRLEDIGRRPGSLLEVEGQYMGLLRFSARGWAELADFLKTLPPERLDKLDMTSLLRALLEQGLEIQTVAVCGGWCEVDNEVDLERYQTRLTQTQSWLHDWRKA